MSKIENSKIKKIKDLYLNLNDPKLHVFNIDSNLYALYDERLDQPLEYDGYLVVENKIKEVIRIISDKCKSIIIYRYKLNSNGFVATIVQNKRISPPTK